MTARLSRNTTIGGLLFLAVLASCPFWLGGEYVVNVAILSAVFVVLSMALNLVYGYTGLLSFAQVGFWGVGGYTSALVATSLGLSPWAGVAGAGLLGAVAALAVGYPALRLSRHSFAIVTLSFALLLQLVARDWVSLTRGPMGIPNLPPLRLVIPAAGTISGTTPLGFYTIFLLYAAVALVVLRWLVGSAIGRTLVAIRENEALAKSQGINVDAYKLLALGVSGLLTGVAGGLYVFHLSIVDPSIFDFYYSELMIIIVILGGAGTFAGVIAASIVFVVLPEVLRITPDLRLVLFGVVLVAAVLAMPGGIGGFFKQRRLATLRRQMAQAAS